METLYTHSHLLVVPSVYESYCLVAAEAISFGLPILNFANGGIRSLVEDDVNGLNINRDQISFKNAMDDVLWHPEKIEKWIKGSSEIYARLNTWEQSANRAYTHFKGLIDVRTT